MFQPNMFEGFATFEGGIRSQGYGSEIKRAQSIAVPKRALHFGNLAQWREINQGIS